MLRNSQQYIENCTPRIDIPIADAATEEFPIAWEKTFYKSYPRFRTIDLNPSGKLSLLRKTIKKRRSCREFGIDPITFQQLSDLLYWSLGEVSESKGIKHRAYPSAGGRFPIECYLICRNVEDLKAGLYHYNVSANSLELITSKASEKNISAGFFAKFTSASVFLLLTGVFSRAEVKYGTKALSYIFTEAGQISQNIALNCQDSNLASCTIGGYDTELLSALFDLDVFDEVPVCCFAVGNPRKGGGKR